MWCLAHPKIGEREVVVALLERHHHLIRNGQILLADKGFSGKAFKQLTEDMGIRISFQHSAPQQVWSTAAAS